MFVLVVPVERIFPRHQFSLRRPALGTDIAYALTTVVFGAVGVIAGLVVSIVSLAWLPGLALRPLVALVPDVPRAVLGVLLFDLVSYWGHRFAHEVPFMWRFHSIHHSTERLDWVSGFRNHPFDGALVAPGFVMLIAAGFSPEFSGVLAAIQLVTGLFLHANVRFRWRPLQRLVITPEFHHWHHANEPAAINTNYSIFLPVWDQLFGTYRVPRGERPTVYGVSEPVPDGIARQLWHPLRGLRNPIRMLRHPVRAAGDVAVMVRRGVVQMIRSARRNPST